LKGRLRTRWEGRNGKEASSVLITLQDKSKCVRFGRKEDEEDEGRRATGANEGSKAVGREIKGEETGEGREVGNTSKLVGMEVD